MQSSKRPPIFVTTPSLPPLLEYSEILSGVWDRRILTHNGPLVQKLEKELIAKLGLKNIVVTTNGTIAIQLAIRSLGLTGEIITTPFTWIATLSAIIWENCTPKFVDIDRETFNLDPKKIEAAITEKTKAILAVHVFSNPCDIGAIESLAQKYNLKVIYDAAHAMCVNYNGKSLLEYGDISATSFHATKLFNTGEGGACITCDDELNQKLKRLRFFGHDDAKEVVEDGCNGKMTEIHAALGLANLRYIDEVIAKRRKIYNQYFEQLNPLEFIEFQKINTDSYNFSYMPVLFDTESRLLKIVDILNREFIYPRRYFYPSLNTIKHVNCSKIFPVSEDISRRILCLPSHHALCTEDVTKVCKLIRGVV